MFLKAIKKAVLPVLIGSLLTGSGCRITYGYAGGNSWDAAVIFQEESSGINTSNTDTQQEAASGSTADTNSQEEKNTGDNTSDTDTQQENVSPNTPATDDTLIQAPSALLMEATTGTVIYEKDPDTRRSPASITKIMTLILIFDALENGTLKMTDTVTTSAYAKSMGGSQVFLEEGETQDVETMIKCIVIASGNDASVAMAEPHRRQRAGICPSDERAGSRSWHGKHPFRGLLRLDRLYRPLHHCPGHRPDEPGADH